MKHYADDLLYACCFADCFSKVAGESQILICNDSLWDFKSGKEMLKVEICNNTLTIYGLDAGQKLCGFGTSLIHNGENKIIHV